MNGYKSVDDAMHESNQETQTICRELTRKLASIEEMVNAEQRTLDMQRTMEKRLAGDTGALKLENGELTFKLDKIKYELNSSISTLQLSKVELAEKEKIMEEMHQQANVRRKDRAKRMKLLHGIVDEGSNNLTMIHDAIYEEGKLHHQPTHPPLAAGGAVLEVEPTLLISPMISRRAALVTDPPVALAGMKMVAAMVLLVGKIDGLVHVLEVKEAFPWISLPSMAMAMKMTSTMSLLILRERWQHA